MGDVPSGPITFSSESWKMLERFVNSSKTDLDTKFLKAVSGLRLDGSLETDLQPGSQDWDVVKALTGAAGTFGGSVQTQFTKLSGDWDTFIAALVDGERIFENGDDAAAGMSAQDLLAEEPDLSPGGGV